MKKSSLLKLIVVIGLSLVLAFSVVSVVRAADDSSFPGWDDNPTVQNNTVDPTTNTADSANNTIDPTINTVEPTTNTVDPTINTVEPTINTGNATTDLNTSNNDTNNEVENLAYTGIESNSIMVVVILVVAIIAGYSLKKVREYDI